MKVGKYRITCDRNKTTQDNISKYEVSSQERLLNLVVQKESEHFIPLGNRNEFLIRISLIKDVQSEILCKN